MAGYLTEPYKDLPTLNRLLRQMQDDIKTLKAQNLSTASTPDVDKLADNSDVSLSSPTTGQLLTFNGTKWTNHNAPSGFTAGGDLSGTSTSQTVIGLEGKPLDATTVGAPNNGDVITYNTAAGKYKASAPAPGFTAGGDLSGTSTSQEVVGILSKAIDATSGTIADGNILQYQSSTGKWEPVWVYQKMQGGAAGAPSASQPLLWANVIQPVTFAADFAGSEGNIDPGVGTNPTGTVTLTVKKWVSGVATTIGTISISTSGVFTFATTSHAAQSAGTGDLIAVYNQNPADATLAYPAFTLAAYLGSTAPSNPVTGGGTVSGPGSSVNNDIALFNGTTGNVIKDSGVQTSTDGTMGGASPSDTLLSSQKAIVTYGGGLVPLASLSASASATLTFTTRNSPGQSGAIFQSDFDVYMITFSHLIPSATNAIKAQFSSDGGSTWLTGANYNWQAWRWVATGSAASGSTTDTSFNMTGGDPPTNDTSGASGNFMFYAPTNSGVTKTFNGTYSIVSETVFLGGIYTTATAVNAIKFFPAAGTITSGAIRIYGVR